MLAALLNNQTVAAVVASDGTPPLEPDIWVGSWITGELGRWFLNALADYRETP